MKSFFCGASSLPHQHISVMFAHRRPLLVLDIRPKAPLVWPVLTTELYAPALPAITGGEEKASGFDISSTAQRPSVVMWCIVSDEWRGYQMRSLLTLLLVVPLTGCAGLLIQPDDSTARKATKISARVPLALVSLGDSERIYHCARRADPPRAYALGERRNAAAIWAGLTSAELLDECWQLVVVRRVYPESASAPAPLDPAAYHPDHQASFGQQAQELLEQRQRAMEQTISQQEQRGIQQLQRIREQQTQHQLQQMQWEFQQMQRKRQMQQQQWQQPVHNPCY